MAGGGDSAECVAPPATHTTNAEDQAEVAKLQARIAQSNASSKEPASASSKADTATTPGELASSVPSVQIAEGAHKYVLVSAVDPVLRSGESEPLRRDFVVSRHGAAYHRNAAEPLVYLLEERGYADIRVKGGGRILLDSEKKKIHIFGYSYGFGLADHAKSKSIIEADDRYEGFSVTWSNDGY
uniref:14 kDa phosphohistidine phosphatase n=1 Tax=Pseudictyota dubia TaxID=2749911 RepID=A0A7R9Z4U9_9STRA